MRSMKHSGTWTVSKLYGVTMPHAVRSSGYACGSLSAEVLEFAFCPALSCMLTQQQCARRHTTRCGKSKGRWQCLFKHSV